MVDSVERNHFSKSMNSYCEHGICQTDRQLNNKFAQPDDHHHEYESQAFHKWIQSLQNKYQRKSFMKT